MKFDLHNHSTYSDGKLSVKDLVLRAKEKGLDGFALTDHDSIFGVEEAYNIAKEEGLFLLKGLELSTFYKGDPVHILAFFKHNTPPQAFYDFSKGIVDVRVSRAKKMLLNIEKEFGVKINYDYIFKNSTIITRGNMYQAIIRDNPNISPDDASFMVSTTSPAYIPATKLSTIDGLKLIKDNDAIAVLAHPTLIKREYLDDILSYGFDGIESRYSMNKEGEEEYFRSLAIKYNLFNSAGSDFHGDNKHADIGTCFINEEDFKIILNKLEIEAI